MNRARQSLIDSLTADLAATPRRLPLRVVATLWGLATAIYAAVSMVAMGPFRPGAFTVLLVNPQLSLESALGVAAIVAMTWFAFAQAVPGRTTHLSALCAALLTGAWVLVQLAALVHPAIEPSTFGNRPYCIFEMLIYVLPPSVLGAWLIWRRFPLHAARTGAALVAAAGMVPALLMQFACMYVPQHILLAHILPIAPLALIGGAVAFTLTQARRARG
jgi:hypothetical protein